MKTSVIWGCLTAAALMGCQSKAPQLGKASVEEVIAAMTLEEKVDLLIGTGMEGEESNGAVVGETDNLVPGAAGTSRAIPRLGIPAIVLVDGPAGVRIKPVREGDAHTYYCTQFPMGTMLASTWNQELVESVGASIGQEALEYGTDLLLAPALNIHRNPLCGRNFEYYSEDPLLSGRTAAAYVRGVQSNGVGTTVKHFAVNNQETNRTGNDACVSQRALREIYLKGFETVVREAAPWAIMSSYNRINGTFASESPELLTTLLRDEWGFEGMVMTDWLGGEDPAAMMRAGNDMLQPGFDSQREAILAAVRGKQLDESVLDLNVRRVLETILQSPRFKQYHFADNPDLDTHATVARKAACEGMVLLKNESGTLPFLPSVRRVALFGSISYDYMAGGSGSGSVNSSYTLQLTDALRNAGYELSEELASLYGRHVDAEHERIAALNLDTFTQGVLPPDEMELPFDLIERQAGQTDAAIITLGRRAGEFSDRRMEDFMLKDEERRMIADVCQAFHAAGKKVVVLLNIAGVIETASWKSRPDAILCAWQGGQEGAGGVADALSGKISPSGKLTMTFPLRYEDVPSAGNFPVDITVDEELSQEEKERISRIKDVGYTFYEEDIYVGYRYYDTFHKEVSYPFGYGLSYTSFEYLRPSIQQAGGSYLVSVDVKNTGVMSGKEVVQLYVAAPDTTRLGKPTKELKAFAKTRELAPGEMTTVILQLPIADLASFDTRRSAWVTEGGTYRLELASSSQDVRATLNVEIAENVREVNDILKPKRELKVLRKP